MQVSSKRRPSGDPDGDGETMSTTIQERANIRQKAKIGKQRKSDQLIQVTLKFKMPGGKIRVHTLANEEAQRWSDWAEAVCISAWNQGVDPDWTTLNWAIHEQVSAPDASPGA